MGGAKSTILWFLCAGLGVSGCFSVKADSSDDKASVSIDSLSAEPETVNDGDTFDVAWQVSHTTTAGYVTEIGLYLGTPADLATASGRDSRSLFVVSTTAGAPNDASASSVSCTRTGTSVKCNSTYFSSRDIKGVTDFTFRACNSYVLSSDEACETRAVTLHFP